MEKRITYKGKDYIWNGKNFTDIHNITPPTDVKYHLHDLLLQDGEIFNNKSNKELYQIAIKQNRLRQWDLSIEACKKILEKDEMNFGAKITLASSLRQCGRAKEALKILDNILNQNDQPAMIIKALTSKAACYCDLNDLDSAKKFIDTAYSLCNKNKISNIDHITLVYKRIKKIEKD